jgi:hypothetical protein
MTPAPTLQLLEWLKESDRSYADTVAVWHSHCPRLMVWEDAIADGLVAVRDGCVVLTKRGLELVQ